MPDDSGHEVGSFKNPALRVQARIAADFPPTQRAEIMAQLAQYRGNEIERVQLDILQLAAGDPVQVAELVGRARQDYRDILFWAEYPEESRLDTPAKQAAIRQLFRKLGVEPPPGL